MDTREKLNQLAELHSQRDLLAIEKQRVIDSVITPEIKAQLAAIDEEFAEPADAVTEKITALEAEIKAEVAAGCKTVKGDFMQAVFTSGRVSWDTDKLEGYVMAHPELSAFRKVGKPSVSFRRVNS